MTKIPPALAERGREARQRAMDRAGSSRINDAAWWPEVELLLELGYEVGQVAAALNMSPRRLRDIRRHGSTSGHSYVYAIAEPKQGDELAPEHAAMLEFSADAYELFFNAFSGKILPPHCKEWVREFIENTNLLLNVPPRHAKTTCLAVWLPLWLIARDRNEEILIVSKTHRFARDQAAEIAFNLRSNKALTDAFGRFSPEKEKDATWRPSAGEILVLGRTRTAQSGQMSIRAVGSGGQILGSEATVVIVDDCTDASITRSETKREDQLSWLRNEVFTRLQPGGHAIVLGQRVHFLDLYGELASQEYVRGPHRGRALWTTISHPAISVWPNPERGVEAEVLWPDFWTFDSLMDTYERIGDAAFSCMYQQEPLSAGAAIVQPEWWERCHDPRRLGFEGHRLEEGKDGFLPIARVISLDPSPTRFNGLVVADVPYTRDSFFASIMETKSWVGGMRSIVAELERAVRQYHPDYLIIEHSTYTGWLHEDPLFQTLSSLTTLIPHNTGKNKGDPLLGVESLGSDVEFGRLSLPMSDAAGQQMSKVLEDEMNVWPNGQHDDVLMALWFIKWNYRKLIPRGALPTSFRGGGPGGQGWAMNKLRPQKDLVKWYREQRANQRKAG